MVGLEQRELDVGVDAAAREQPSLDADEREVATRGDRAAGGELGLAERDDVLRQREALDRRAEATDRAGEVAARGLDLRQPDLGRRMVRQHEQRLAIRDRGRAEVAAGELEVAEQRLHVGRVLGRPAAGRDGELHRGNRAAQVAVQLAEVGDARVGREIGAAVDHLLQRAAGRAVAAELDERVDEDAVRLRDVGRGAAGRERVAQARAEVVARGLERGALGQRAGVARGEVERAAQDRVGADVVRRVAGLADLLRVRVREEDVAVGAARVGAHGRLEDPDALVGRRARGRRIGRGAQRRGVRGRAGDAVPRPVP